MKCFDKFKKEILERVTEYESPFALVDGKIVSCNDCKCSHCQFNSSEDCVLERIKWLYSEYKEPIVLTAIEHEILSQLKDAGKEFITIDEDRSLYASIRVEGRFSYSWSLIGREYIPYWLNCFKFVHWEDEPYSIDELLKCKVAE